MVLENEALGLDQPTELKPFSTTIPSPSSPSPSASPEKSLHPTSPEETINNLAHDLSNYSIDPEILSDDPVSEKEEESEREELITNQGKSKRKKNKSRVVPLESESEEEYEASRMVKKGKRGKSALKKSSNLISEELLPLPLPNGDEEEKEGEMEEMPIPAKKSRRAKRGKGIGISPSVSGTSTPVLEDESLSTTIATPVEGGTTEGNDGREMSKKDKRRAKEAAKSGVIDELVRLAPP